jgi:4-diphosphocytidyl-2-C-methyl-D-erythritol kinase
MEEIAYAKINLALHVRERLADGYHRIETLFAFAEDGDRLRAAEGEAIGLDLEGPFASALAGQADNLVLRAARALAAGFGVARGARLTLYKRLPVASGIGGGSADAAATLRMLTRFWCLEALEDDLLAIARGLGADVPACLLSRTLRGEGRGDALTPIPADDLAGTPLLLVNPGVALSTASVFAGWDGVDRGSLPPDPAEGRNDLEPSAIALAPAIADVLDVLRKCEGVRLARMSGSGATCFGLFASEAARDAAAARIGRDRPGWWFLSTRLR